MRISDWSSDVCSSDLLPAHHALAEKGAAEREAVEAADEPIARPAFARMCEAPVMQLDEHALDRGVDPRIGTVRDRFGAQGKDIGEGGVGGDAEPTRRDRLAQRSGYAEPIERQDRPLARLDPEDRTTTRPTS